MGARTILERLYGFAEPTADGPGIVCAYCDASTADGGLARHEADCAYWDARAAFDSPAAGRLVARLAGSAS